MDQSFAIALRVSGVLTAGLALSIMAGAVIYVVGKVVEIYLEERRK